MKKLFFAFTILISSVAVSQQETQYSMYFFNPLFINPAYAGSQDALNITALYRSQWTNIDGAPKSTCLTVHSPLKNEHLGIGATIANDQIGAIKNTSTFVDLSYSIQTNKKGNRLAFGLKIGADYFQKNYSNLKVQQTIDNVYLNNLNNNQWLFNTGFGIYYYGKKFYVGTSSPRLISNQLNKDNQSKAYQKNHFYVFSGFVYSLNPILDMRPSFAIKYTHNSPLSIEGNLSFFLYEKIWVGLMYRHNSFIGANISYLINEKFKVGYAYDYSTNSIQNYSSNTHEIMLSYDLKTKSKGFRSPRYF